MWRNHWELAQSFESMAKFEWQNAIANLSFVCQRKEVQELDLDGLQLAVSQNGDKLAKW